MRGNPSSPAAQPGRDGSCGAQGLDAPHAFSSEADASTAASGSGETVASPPVSTVDILIPTCNRPAALAITLTALLAQTWPSLRVVVSDQGDAPVLDASPELATVLRLLRAKNRPVELLRHLPRRGMAEQRQFLLDQARAPYVLFLDDDVIIEPDLVERLVGAISGANCGFVGSAVLGMSYIDDVRPHQQAIEFWDGPVEPERILPDDPRWARHHLHSAANLYHVQQKLGLDAARERLYRVAWVGGCVLFDTARLREVGGFGFWERLPAQHCGEDVLAQLRVMARYGGCGLIPSGAYHQELPTTVPERHCDAPKVLGDLLA
jgi:GT2 family glycosyltransferase